MDKLKLARRIKAERINRNLSQKQLAELTGVNNTVLCRIESGEKDISIENLIKIARVFEVDVDYLLFDCVSDNPDAVFENVLKQVNKLEPERKQVFKNLCIVLLENKERLFDGRNPIDTGKAVDYTEIGRRVRHERLKQKLTQEKLSEFVGITDNFLSAIETGRETMSLETLFRIASALKTPVARLLVNADANGPNASLCDALESLSHMSDRHSCLLINLITVLMDNSDKW